MNLLELTALSCAGMIAADAFGTVLVVAESRGWENVAGLADVQVDFWGKCILTAYGLENLTHSHGVVGWLCTLPVFATGFLSTKYATRHLTRRGHDKRPHRH